MSALAVTFAFAVDAQSFAGTAGAASKLTYNAGTGNPAGSLQSAITGKSKSNSNSWSQALSYEAMGVPSNSTITGITAASMDSKCITYTTGASSTAGTAILVDGATTITLAASRAFTATDGAWITSKGTDKTGMSSASSNSTTITIKNALATGSSTSAAVTLLQDQLTFTVTYNTAFAVSTSETMSGSDGLNAVATIGSTISETSTISDGIDETAAMNASTSESAAVSDNLSAIVNFLVSVIEASTASDDASSLSAFHTNVSEVSHPSDAMSAIAVFLAGVTENASADEIASATANFLTDTSESAAIAEFTNADLASVMRAIMFRASP